MTTPRTSQEAQRRIGLKARRSMSDSQRRLASRFICRKFLRSASFFSAKRIGVYLSLWDEVDTKEIILRSWRAKKEIFAPLIDKHHRMQFAPLRPDGQLERGAFGILQPKTETLIDPSSFDIVVTPLAAFDEKGNRIGMGGGYYDRCFSYQSRFKHWRKPKLIGLSFKCQQVEEIALNHWDIPLYAVFTE